MKIILASGSPRRKELLELAGYDFTIEVSDADEDIIQESPQAMVEELSFRKAAAVAKKYQKESGNPERPEVYAESSLIIGADTVVALDGEILGKPKDKRDAARMLLELSGRTHQVYTGVSLIFMDGKQISDHRTFSECTDVTMRELSDEEIDTYISSGEPMDKAGAYGIQGKAAVFISGIRGDYYNVVGLPICRMMEEIKKCGSFRTAAYSLD